MESMLETIHEKALNLYNEYMCIGGMPSNILEYIKSGKDISKYKDDLSNIIITI